MPNGYALNGVGEAWFERRPGLGLLVAVAGPLIIGFAVAAALSRGRRS